jgi:hypothetical protein
LTGKPQSKGAHVIKEAIRILVLTSVFASGIAAAATIDQVTGVGVPYSGVNNLSGKLQEFTPTQNNVAGGGFYFSKLYKDAQGLDVPVNMTIAVWNGLPGTGSVIASGTALLSKTGWLDAFWSPVSIVPGASYYLALTTAGVPLNSSSNPANGGTEPVVNGGFFNYSGNSYQYNPTNPPPKGSLQGPYGFDWSFRTYYDDAPSPVPLPAAAWLLLSGLGGLGFLGRRRKA